MLAYLLEGGRDSSSSRDPSGDSKCWWWSGAAHARAPWPTTLVTGCPRFLRKGGAPVAPAVGGTEMARAMYGACYLKFFSSPLFPPTPRNVLPVVKDLKGLIKRDTG